LVPVRRRHALHAARASYFSPPIAYLSIDGQRALAAE
jgi:hypothetical protein